MASRFGNCPQARLNTELPEERLDVATHGVRAQEHPLGDVLGGEALVEKCQDLDLALAIEPLLTWRPDVVVLPQALCDGIYDDELRRALIRALTTFASDTGTTLHAAGVNDRNEADLLWALGVTWASGPLFSDRPPNHAVGPEAATDLGSILSAVP